MVLLCPKCGQEIKTENINVATNVALCGACGEILKLSEFAQKFPLNEPAPQADNTADDAKDVEFERLEPQSEEQTAESPQENQVSAQSVLQTSTSFFKHHKKIVIIAAAVLAAALMTPPVVLLAKNGFAKAHYNSGIAHNENAEYDKAITEFTDVIRIKPNYVDAYYNRGVAFVNKGDSDRAIADYTQAIRIDPNYADAYNNRGHAYYNKGDYRRALADFYMAEGLEAQGY